MPIYYENPNVSEFIEEQPIEFFITPRPWIRYFARIIDMYLGSMLVSITWASLSPITYNKVFIDYSSEYVSWVILCIIWLVIESIMISTLGTTPGKWTFSSKVISVNGGKLKFSKALLRSFSMLFSGLGLMIPIVSLFTLSNSYKQVKNQNYGGYTKWDIQTKSVVITNKLNPIKVALLITLFIASSVSYNYYCDNQASIISENSTVMEQLDEMWTELDNERILLNNWEAELTIQYNNIAELNKKLEESSNSDNETEYGIKLDNYNSIVDKYNVEEAKYETRLSKYNSDVDIYTKKYDELMGTEE